MVRAPHTGCDVANSLLTVVVTSCQSQSCQSPAKAGSVTQPTVGVLHPLATQLADQLHMTVMIMPATAMLWTTHAYGLASCARMRAYCLKATSLFVPCCVSQVSSL